MRRAAPVFMLFLFCLAILAAQDGAAPREAVSALPLELARPRYGEEPRFPRDYVIGELGRGGATEESYRLARQVAAGLAAGNGKTERVEFPEQKRLSVLQNIGGLGTRSWRVGGGRDEGDGGYSFLIRFLGRDRSVTGELYLRRPLATPAAADAGETNAVASETSAATETSGTGNVSAAVNASGPARWLVDDVLLEGPRSLAEGKYGPAGADMAAYERFF